MILKTKPQIFYYENKNEMSLVVFDKVANEVFSDTKKFFENKDNLIESKIDFLEKSIFKVEKKFNIFVNTINLIIDKEYFTEINISTKNYKNHEIISKENVEYLLSDLKRYVHENNQNSILTFIKINNFKVKGNIFENFSLIPITRDYSIEVKFKFLLKQINQKLKTKFSNIEIDINKIYSSDMLDLSSANSAYDICISAANHYFFSEDLLEVSLVKEVERKKGFFERFFEFFD